MNFSTIKQRNYAWQTPSKHRNHCTTHCKTHQTKSRLCPSPIHPHVPIDIRFAGQPQKRNEEEEEEKRKNLTPSPPSHTHQGNIYLSVVTPRGTPHLCPALQAQTHNKTQRVPKAEASGVLAASRSDFKKRRKKKHRLTKVGRRNAVCLYVYPCYCRRYHGHRHRHRHRRIRVGVGGRYYEMAVISTIMVSISISISIIRLSSKAQGTQIYP